MHGIKLLGLLDGAVFIQRTVYTIIIVWCWLGKYAPSTSGSGNLSFNFMSLYILALGWFSNKYLSSRFQLLPPTWFTLFLFPFLIYRLCLLIFVPTYYLRFLLEIPYVLYPVQDLIIFFHLLKPLFPCISTLNLRYADCFASSDLFLLPSHGKERGKKRFNFLDTSKLSLFVTFTPSSKKWIILTPLTI